MRICCVIASLGSGGAERVMVELCRAWAARGDDVTLLTLADGSGDFYQVPAGVTRRALAIAGGSASLSAALSANAQRLRVMRSALASARPDVIVSFTDSTNVLVLLAARGQSVPVVVSERIDPRLHEPGRSWRALRRLVYPTTQALVVQTSSVRQWAETLVAPRRVHVIPNPVRTVAAPTTDAGVRGPGVVAMGRLVPQKGFDVLLAAFAQVHREHRDWTLTVYGEGPERERLTALAATLGIADVVRLPGRTSDADLALRSASVFALSSRYEGFPNALLEAMAAGCACVSTDCPSGPADLVEPERTGLLVPVGDADAMARALSRLMADAALRARLGTAAHADSSRFAIDQVLAHWDRVFGAIVAGRRVAA